MKTAAAALLAASMAAMANAQAMYHENNGTYTCSKPGASYCAGPALGTDIIIRCDSDGVATTGRCTDNLAGQPPVGVKPALCWQTSETSGDAACEKNCVVYADASFTLPSDQCTMTYTPNPRSSTKTKSGSVTKSASRTKSTSGVVRGTGTGTAGTGGPTAAPSNGTCVTCRPSSTSRLPVGPTVTPSDVPSAPGSGAAGVQVGGALALVGLVAAYLV